MTTSIVKTGSPKDVTRAVDLLGGIKKFVSKGDKVLIKPNMMIGLNSPATTDPRVVRQVILMCERAGASKITVGENPLQQICSRKMFEGLGYINYFKRAGAEVAFLDEEEQQCVKVDGLVLSEVALPKSLLEADVHVSVPKLKTHIMTGITCAIKNNQGMINDPQKIKCHRSDLNAKLVDMLKVAAPDLIVVDGIVGMEGQGPVCGDPVESNVIIAGDNAVDVDCACARVMGFSPETIETCRLGLAHGFGTETVPKGAKISQVQKKFRPAVLSSIGEIKQVKVSCGGGCLGCLGNFRYGVDLLKKFMPEELDKINGLVVYMGMDPVPVDAKHAILFGNCACKSVNIEGATKVPGCPPAEWMEVLQIVADKFGLPMLDFTTLSLKRFKK